MQSFYRFPDPGPETEAQKERAKYLGLAAERVRERRRARWQALTRVFRK